MCLKIYYITNPLYFVDLVCEIRYNNVDFKATFQNKGQEVIKMGKTILTAIIVAVLDCAIAAVKEIGE